jgi:hypothetical protein
MTDPTPTPEASDSKAPMLLAVVGAGLAVPGFGIGLAGTRAAAKWARVPASTLFLLTVPVVLAGVALAGVPDVPALLGATFTAWKALLAGTGSVPALLAAGGPWALAAGMLTGAAWSAAAQRKDPSTILRPGLRAWWTARQLHHQIRTSTFQSGVTVGVLAEDPAARVAISTRTANGHLLVTGATGSGKTVGVLAMLTDAAAQGDPIVYLDLKGGNTVPTYLAGLAARHGRRFQHFALFDTSGPYEGPASDGPALYNPAAYGDATRRKDLLTKSCGSDVAFYRNMTQDFVQAAFAVLLTADPTLGGKGAIAAISDVMDPRKLLATARMIPPAHPHSAKLVKLALMYVEQMKNREFMSSLKTFQTYLGLFTGSIAGPLIAPGDNVIDFADVDAQASIVCFSLNSSLYSDLAGRLATLVVEDLTTYAGSRFGQDVHPFRVVVDEFAVVDGTNVLNLIARGREAGMCITLATQTLADLEQHGAPFRRQVVDNLAGFVTFRTNSEDDARTYSGLTGHIDATSGYEIAWQEYQRLERGQCYVLNKTPEGKGKKRERAVQKTSVIMRTVPQVPLTTVHFHSGQATVTVDEPDWLVGDPVEDPAVVFGETVAPVPVVPVIAAVPDSGIFTGLDFTAQHAPTDGPADHVDVDADTASEEEGEPAAPPTVSAPSAGDGAMPEAPPLPAALSEEELPPAPPARPQLRYRPEDALPAAPPPRRRA